MFRFHADLIQLCGLSVYQLTWKEWKTLNCILTSVCPVYNHLLLTVMRLFEEVVTYEYHSEELRLSLQRFSKDKHQTLPESQRTWGISSFVLKVNSLHESKWLISCWTAINITLSLKIQIYQSKSCGHALIQLSSCLTKWLNVVISQSKAREWSDSGLTKKWFVYFKFEIGISSCSVTSLLKQIEALNIRVISNWAEEGSYRHT